MRKVEISTLILDFRQLIEGISESPIKILEDDKTIAMLVSAKFFEAAISALEEIEDVAAFDAALAAHDASSREENN